MEYLLGIIALLVGGFFYQKSKRETAEGLNKNLETKEKLNDINKDVSKNQGQIESEEINQAKLKKELENVKTGNAHIDSVLDLLRKR